MTIPTDSMNRCWIEIGGANPELVDSFRDCLLGFLAFNRGRVPGLAGTGFVVAASPECALIVTAKHVLEEVHRLQRPYPISAPSAIFTPPKTPSLEPKECKIVWAGRDNSLMLNINHACYIDPLDIASCIVLPQEKETIAKIASIPLDVDDPEVGEVVQMVTMQDMDVQENEPPGGIDDKYQKIAINRTVSVRVGVVTGIYPQGYRQYRFPCFTTSIPAKPGMSGGFVCRTKAGETIGACGVVSADISPDTAHRDFYSEGESIIACTWPALALRVPEILPAHKETPDSTLFEMMQKGNLPKPIGDFGKIGIQALDNGQSRISKSD